MARISSLSDSNFQIASNQCIDACFVFLNEKFHLETSGNHSDSPERFSVTSNSVLPISKTLQFFMMTKNGKLSLKKTREMRKKDQITEKKEKTSSNHQN